MYFKTERECILGLENFSFSNERFDFFRDNKTIVKVALSVEPFAFQDVDSSLKDDKNFILELLNYAIHNDKGFYFLHCLSEKLKNDSDIVFKIAFMKSAIFELSMMGEKLKNDKKFLRKLLTVNICFFEFFSDNLKSDKELIKELIVNEEIFKYIDDLLKQDLNFVKELFEINNKIFRFFPEEVRSNESIAFDAVKADLNNFLYLNLKLKRSKKFLIKLLKLNINITNFLDDDVLNDKEIMEVALDNVETFTLEQAGERLKNNKSFALKMIKKGYDFIFLDLGKNLQNDLSVFSIAIKKNAFYFTKLKDELRKDKLLILSLIKINSEVLDLVDDDVKSDDLFIKELIKVNSLNFQYLPLNKRKDINISKMFIAKNKLNLLFCENDLLKNDKKFILSIFKKNESGRLFRGVGKSLWFDKEVLEKALLNLDFSSSLSIKEEIEKRLEDIKAIHHKDIIESILMSSEIKEKKTII